MHTQSHCITRTNQREQARTGIKGVGIAALIEVNCRCKHFFGSYVIIGYPDKHSSKINEGIGGKGPNSYGDSRYYFVGL